MKKVGGVILGLLVFLATPVFASPAITSLSTASGPAGSAIMIFGSGFGATQGGSTVSLSSVAATVTAWSDTEIGAVVPANASSGPFSVTVGGQAASSATFTVIALPSAWSDADVGAVGVNGNAFFPNWAFTVQGGGGPIFGSADAFQFVYRTLPGHGTLIARVRRPQGYSGGVARGVSR